MASGRPMEQIAAGKGRAPKPFMLPADTKAEADAVWHSNKGDFEGAGAEAVARAGGAAGAARAGGGAGKGGGSRSAVGAGGSTQAKGATERGRLPSRAAEEADDGRPQAAPTDTRSARTATRGKHGGASEGESGKTVRTAMPSFIEPQLAQLVDRPPSTMGWGHELKLDGYRLQLRVEKGRVVLRTRTGLNWTEKFGAIANAREACPTASWTARRSH